MYMLAVRLLYVVRGEMWILQLMTNRCKVTEYVRVFIWKQD